MVGCPKGHFLHSQQSCDGHPRKLWEPLVQQTLDKKTSHIMKIKMYKTKTCGRLKELTDSLTFSHREVSSVSTVLCIWTGL